MHCKFPIIRSSNRMRCDEHQQNYVHEHVPTLDKMNLSLDASLGLDTEKKKASLYQNILNQLNPNLLMISHQNI